MIDLVNRQRRRKIDANKWQALAANALKAVDRNDADATIAFVSDRRMRELNRTFRGIDSPTDVLSFPAGAALVEETDRLNLGDIAISVDRAATQAAENGLEFDREVAQLILHGLLHLCGYDHETDNGEMNALELRLRRRLGI